MIKFIINILRKFDKWHPGIMWNNCQPLLFPTRREAREFIEKEYGYIKTRDDLRRAPFNWRLPKAVRVNVEVTEIKNG